MTSAGEHGTSAGWWAEYSPLQDEPIAEWLQGASCSPACKAIMICAARAWDRGWTADQWRQDLLSKHQGEADLRLIGEAEECMRSSGLWLWNS